MMDVYEKDLESEKIQAQVDKERLLEEGKTRRHISTEWTRRVEIPLRFWESGDAAKMIIILVVLGVTLTFCLCVLGYFHLLPMK